ncbi:MAG TPA: hypothetical protein VFG63_02410 [Nocardioidaceae bacterium]|nr:hypothetical protein [Nocardioidaceae bacterium]
MSVRPTRLGRKTKLSALAAAAVVALSGCGALHPGAAAVVGSTTISHDAVDGLAAALCTANVKGAEAGGQATQFSTRSNREGALQVLLESRLSHLFGEKRDVEANRQTVSQALAQNETVIQALPEDESADYRQALKDYAEGQLMLVEIGRKSLQDQGKTGVTEDQALAEGHKLRNKFAKSLDVEIDPRYGNFSDGTLKSGGTSLSVAESDDARAGEKAEPAADFVSGLPASQRCS